MTLPTIEALCVPLANARVTLCPITEAHREPLRAACAADRDIWTIYSTCLVDAHYDPQFDLKLAGGGQYAYAVLDGETVVGCTSWYMIEPANRAVAIGYTYLAPSVRGGDFNLALKGLMIGHAWGCGFQRIHFDVDTRNTRSIAAVRKLGGCQEGVLRRNKITWTGFVRDTAILSLLPGEESAALRPWLQGSGL
jgi:RimJ/RimL family protein N-acetyltransferase